MTIDPIAIDGNVHRMTTRSRSRFMKNRNQSGDIDRVYLDKDDLSSSGFTQNRICCDDRVSKEGIVVGVEEIAFVSILIIACLALSETPIIMIWTIGIFIIIINCVFGRWDGFYGYDDDGANDEGCLGLDLWKLDSCFRF